MVNYQLGKIYKIIDNTNGNIYIGSSCLPYLSSRLAVHKIDYKNYLKGLRPYITSFKILENGDYDMVLIEECKCDNKMQLHTRERHYIDSLDCVNKRKPLRTRNEWCEENKEQLIEYHKEYRNEIKDVIKEKRILNKELMKTKRDQNKDVLNARKRELYKLKKENNLMV